MGRCEQTWGHAQEHTHVERLEFTLVAESDSKWTHLGVVDSFP
jgi:hypothetical protein